MFVFGILLYVGVIGLLYVLVEVYLDLCGICLILIVGFWVWRCLGCLMLYRWRNCCFALVFDAWLRVLMTFWFLLSFGFVDFLFELWVCNELWGCYRLCHTGSNWVWWLVVCVICWKCVCVFVCVLVCCVQCYEFGVWEVSGFGFLIWWFDVLGLVSWCYCMLFNVCLYWFLDLYCGFWFCRIIALLGGLNLMGCCAADLDLGFRTRWCFCRLFDIVTYEFWLWVWFLGVYLNWFRWFEICWFCFIFGFWFTCLFWFTLLLVLLIWFVWLFVWACWVVLIWVPSNCLRLPLFRLFCLQLVFRF